MYLLLWVFQTKTPIPPSSYKFVCESFGGWNKLPCWFIHYNLIDRERQINPQPCCQAYAYIFCRFAKQGNLLTTKFWKNLCGKGRLCYLGRFCLIQGLDRRSIFCQVNAYHKFWVSFNQVMGSNRWQYTYRSATSLRSWKTTTAPVMSGICGCQSVRRQTGTKTPSPLLARLSVRTKPPSKGQLHTVWDYALAFLINTWQLM